MAQTRKEDMNPAQFADSLNMGMTNGEFVNLIEFYLTPEEIEVLGGQDVASAKLADSWTYLAVFAPKPATFNKEAFLGTAGADLPDIEANRSWEVALRLGVLQDESGVGAGRVSVTQQMTEKLGQFLTE